MTKLACQQCGKRLSRKTARLIDGKVMCSACLFPKRDTSWFHDPAQLRQRADSYDILAQQPAPAGIASAWAGKARALRSRAGAIERAAASVDTHPKDGDASSAAPLVSGAVRAEGEADARPTASKEPTP